MNIKDVKFEKNNYNIDLLKNFMQKCIDNKYKVYVSDYDNLTYFHVVKNNNICYVELNRFTGLSFSSVYKGSKEEGSGAQIYTEISNPELNHIDLSFNKSYGKVEFYSNWEEYADTKNYGRKYHEVK